MTRVSCLVVHLCAIICLRRSLARHPYFFSRVTVDDPNLAGMFLDSRPSNPNRALQMETQYVPSVQATDKEGQQNVEG
ncbi:MAG: hypothetical protein IH892_13050 [Planctomycetes bacterium]|nr:hypothetical protein [Planctomycetota bacterium]